MNRIHHFLFLLLSFSIALQSHGQASMMRGGTGPVFENTDHLDWVDSTFNSLSMDERIGQLFMVAAYSNKGADHMKYLETLVTDQKIGGIMFLKGTPHAQAVMTNELQAKSKVPLMIAMDAEWGLAMRLDSTIKYPRQMMLGAIRNDSIIYEMGGEIGRQSRRLGVHIDFAPVVDVNNNPNNPVIGNRSFGENKWKVAQKGTAYMQGLQSQGVLANAKHFPGHGDTDVDSHKALPIIDFDRMRLDSLELFPFRQLMSRGLGSVMVAHLYIPQLDSTPNLASTLSPVVVNGLLKEEMGFRGLAFTDALNMKGVAKYWEPGEVELKALLAGNDVLLFPEDVPDAITRIKQALKDSLITGREIDNRVHKILMAKAWMGLHSPQQINLNNLVDDLNSERGQRVNQLLHERSITLLENKEDILPKDHMSALDFDYLSIGDYLNNGFHKRLKEYGELRAFSAEAAPSQEKIDQILKKIPEGGTVVVSFRGMRSTPKKNFGLSDSAIALVKALDEKRKVVLVVFGNPYALARYKGLTDLEGLIVTYQQDDWTDMNAAQLIMGELDAHGRLPVSIGNQYAEGAGQSIDLGILQNGMPEEFGLSTGDLDRIDSIAIDGIDKGAYPGCAVVVAKEGKVIYEKAFGHHTYEKSRGVDVEDIYDLASITKVCATAACIIRLEEEGELSVEDVLSQHLPEIDDTSDYRNMRIHDILTHQAGLVPWIPFYTATLEGGKPSEDLYRKTRDEVFNVQVAEDVWMHYNQKDTILQRILSTKVREEKKYKYSDLGYYLMKEIIERKVDMPFEDYVNETFYRPMGLRTMGYLPLERFSRDKIVPTEYDMYYRMQLLQGHVHDMGAAMQGGVGGHAGLFSNARDLAGMMQMYLDGGVYANQRLLSQEIIEDFSECHSCLKEKGSRSNRGVAFDKPNKRGEDGPTCDCISMESFGHTGFTGTLAWADPEEDIVYVFLSNRIYPSMDNKKLGKMNIRTNIMEVIYDSIDRSRTKGLEGDSLGLGFTPLILGGLGGRE